MILPPPNQSGATRQNDKPTRPPKPDKDLPVYYRGQIIYYDWDAKDNCKWVVYNGFEKCRCVSFTSAVSYIDQKAGDTKPEALERLRACALQLGNITTHVGKVLQLARGTEIEEPTEQVLLGLKRVLDLLEKHIDKWKAL